MWMKDIEAAAKNPEKTYEIYIHMPIEDYHAAWRDVEGWHRVDAECTERMDIWETNAGEDIVERVLVYMDPRNGTVEGCALAFRCPDEKRAKRVYNFIRTSFTRYYKKAGTQDYCYNPKPTPYPYKLYWIREDKKVISYLLAPGEKNEVWMGSGAYNPQYSKYE